MAETESHEPPRANWDTAADGWSKHADDVQRFAMPVSAWMLDHAALHPGQRVLELAAGPGDTGFLAAELIQPGGTLVCSDASDGMLDVARERARAKGIENVEFRRLELEWIDLETASVDAILCRWGYMLAADPETAFREARRVLRPGGRLALAVWDSPDMNPEATIMAGALERLGLGTAPPPPGTPGRFALADRDRLTELLAGAGFLEIVVTAIDVSRAYDRVGAFLEEARELSPMHGDLYANMTAEEVAELERMVAELAAPYTGDDGSLVLPARSLVAAAGA